MSGSSDHEDGATPDDSRPRQEILPPLRAAEQTPELLTRLLDIERERIASADKRTDVQRLAIEANVASDNRQFDFHMERLRLSGERSQRRDSLARIIIFSGMGVATIIGGFLLWLAFFGTEQQSAVALKVIYLFLTAVGGYGIVTTARHGLRHLLQGGTDADDA